MPWYRLPSGVLWHARSAPAGAVPAAAPGVMIDQGVDVPVDHLTQPAVVGAGVEVDLAADLEQPDQIRPGVVGAAGDTGGDRTEPVTDLAGLTVAALRDRAERLGLDPPLRARKAALISMIHDAEGNR